MSKILHVDASSRSTTSVTRKLSKELVEAFKKSEPSAQVTYRNLIEEKMPFIHEADINAMFTPPDARSAEQKELFAHIEKNLESFLQADTYVFGVPMYNFSVPAVFKAFIDMSVIAGKTFSYENGTPKGLLRNKKAYVLTASGGDYSKEPYSNYDFLEPYLRAILGFIGITDITFVKVHGHSEEEIAAGTAAAREKIAEFGAAYNRSAAAVG